MVENVIKAKLLASKDDGDYKVYVFLNEDSKEYVMCTMLPNWNSDNLSNGDTGFLKYQIVRAGDEYTTPLGEEIRYRYSNIYFNNFIRDNKNKSTKSIIL
jgi:hypothetical protein